MNDFRVNFLVALASCAYGTTFTEYTYTELLSAIDRIDASHPGCMQVFDIGKEYPDFVGKSLECSIGTPCEHMVIVIGNLSNSEAPQVLLSGAVHGDERPGPISVLETVRLICEGVTGLDFSDRTLIAIPAANSWGYNRNRRDEDGVDPNRDFPYDRDPSLTFQSMASRVINKMFEVGGNVQSGITFHAGVSSITYPWGSPNHMGEDAPDKTALAAIAEELRNVSGRKSSETWNYDIGDMNTVVYPVSGGMEDWAYSLGFEKSPYCTTGDETPVCSLALPSASLFLVEASDSKSVSNTVLGCRDDVWDAGYDIALIPRLIRMSLKVIDLVKPRARIIPMMINGSVPLEVTGCQEISKVTVTCTGGDARELISSPLTCAQEPILIQPNAGCGDMQLDVTFDSHWSSTNGYLKYTKNRSSEVHADHSGYPAAACTFLKDDMHACITTTHLYIHPGFIRYRPTVYLGADVIASNVTSTLVSISVTPEQITPDNSLRLEASTDESVSFSAPLETSTTTTPEDSSWLLWGLLIGLLVPATVLIIFAIVKYRRHGSVYGTVPSTSPRPQLVANQV
jgi:hypothetical protein